LLFDEMFSPVIADELRRRGHDVIAVAEDPSLRASSDADLFAWARERGRRIVTENVADFRPLLLADPRLPGVLFTSSRSAARSARAFGAMIRALEGWILAAGESPPPPEAWLTPSR